MAMGTAPIGKQGPEMLIGNCMPIQTGTQKIGDLFIDDVSGTFGVWNGTDWAMIDSQGNPFLTGDGASRPQPLATYPCPYCGMLNPPDVLACGENQWNGCGAPLRGQ